MNEFYSKDLGRKTSRALAQKAYEGWWPGYAPIGYINKTIPETKMKIIAIDDKNAHHIKKAFERFATDKYTIDSLNEELYKEGFRSKTGKKMGKSSMSVLLKNIFYTGKMKVKNQIYQGKHTPLVDMETFLKVQKTLDLHNHKADRSRKHSFLLSNLLFCKECQSRLTGEKHVKKSGLVFDYYRCMGPKHKEKNCKQPFVPVNKFEKEIVKIFKKITLTSNYLAALKISLERIYQAQNKKDYSWIKSLENKKTAVLKKMDKMEDLLLEDIIDRKRLIEKYSQLKDELSSIEDQIRQAKGTNNKKLEKGDIEKILNFIKRLDNIYISLSPDKKKIFLKILIDKIFVKEKKISDVVYAPVLQMIIDKDIVRIGTNWLQLLDLIRTIEHQNLISFEILR